MKKKLFHVSAYYKNDNLHGLGFTLEDNEYRFQESIEKSIQAYEEDWKSLNKKERKEAVKTYFAQLEHFSKLRAEGKGNEIQPQETMICIINIWFLENHGFLKPDEYNGCVFLYEGENR